MIAASELSALNVYQAIELHTTVRAYHSMQVKNVTLIDDEVK